MPKPLPTWSNVREQLKKDKFHHSKVQKHCENGMIYTVPYKTADLGTVYVVNCQAGKKSKNKPIAFACHKCLGKFSNMSMGAKHMTNCEYYVKWNQTK